MSESSPISAINWPPSRVHNNSSTTPTQTPLRKTRPQLALEETNFESPGNPLAPIKHRKQYRNGYEQTPKTPSFRPFALNNPGTPNQRAFDLSKPVRLKPIPALDPSEWNILAQKNHVIPPGANLRSFQIQMSNLVLMRRGDGIVIAPTGSGKSLLWILPLLARKEGISLVITPFTSLGRDGEHSNTADGITSLFIYSEQNTLQDFEKAATGEMLIIYACPEMVESPSFARLLHSKFWQGRLSGIYIDEAHLIHQSHIWRPSYSRIFQLRNIVGHDIPLICPSATCPEVYRQSLITFAGLHPDYTLVNLGNFRPELSTIILPMEHDINSFLDLTFILPFGARESDLAKIKTLVYADDLDLLTDMFWWAFSRAAFMQILTHTIDIIHSGLSPRHQELSVQDFRDGPTSILFGSSKISAGMNFPGVLRVIQYKCRGLTLPDFDQRRGRGARREGESAVGIIFVEPSMQRGSDVSVEDPGAEDPGMVELVQSDSCAEVIIQRRLDNPPHSRHSSCNCCNRCDPTLHPGREFHWVEVDPAPTTASTIGVKSTIVQRELIFKKLVSWRLAHWRSDWCHNWPSYGPKSLVSDSDLEDLAAHTSKIFSVEDMRRYTHILHWTDLSIPLFEALQQICGELNLLPKVVRDVLDIPSIDEPAAKRRKTAPKQRPEVLQTGEIIIDF
ncbi:P-loop containing nucleoside triphosphate hydrolase protein [Mycena metata]|uniref:DNA 3'-5' helicase n=1 Tax=Mycena metata TaxID=1033252 RepID=A0AAD7N1M2_9AGAR|nr:P-loop containing nucleoside triphosphate hydrolase protein [Mycena metata]